MQVKELNIAIAQSYEKNAGQFVGKVILEGLHGKQEITLSASAISRCFQVIKEDAVAVSRSQAKATAKAIEEAEAGPLLLSDSKIADDDGVPF